MATGCFGYNSSSKKWAYAGNTILMLGGGGAIASDLLAEDTMCVGTGCSTFDPPFGGATVAGAVLITAGIIGIVINATRPTVKTTR